MHAIDDITPIQENANYLDGKIEKYKVKAKQRFRFIYFLYKDTLTALRSKRVYKPDFEMEKAYFRLALNTIAEVSRLAHFPGKEMEATIDDSGPFRILVEDLKEINDDWYYSFHLAVIARDSERLKQILSLPIEFLTLTSGTPATDYSNLLLRLRIKFFGENIFDTQIYEKLISIKEDNASFVMADPAYENITIIFLNQFIVDAMKSLYEEDEAGFNTNLMEALDAHKSYWGQKKSMNPGGPPLCRDNRGFISFYCAALAAMAYDKGWKFEVESDYMPSYMVDGSVMQ